jgi:streptogramin lyase
MGVLGLNVLPSGRMLSGIAAGPDSAMWFTEVGGPIGRFTAAGVVTEYSTGLTAGSNPGGISAGPDGAMWFADGEGRIGRITTAVGSLQQSDKEYTTILAPCENGFLS